MKVGTKSLLFGVHAFWWHPVVVFFAWCGLYKRLPNFVELLGILFHDIGYWGCSDMDGPGGKSHPVLGASLVRWIVTRTHGNDEAFDAYCFTAFHSASFAGRWFRPTSRLCAPDKYSIVFEPKWFYLLRARLSGELDEYKANAKPGLTDSQWFDWLQNKFREKYGTPKQSKRIQSRLSNQGCTPRQRLSGRGVGLD